jgi:hypothetical protein
VIVVGLLVLAACSGGGSKPQVSPAAWCQALNDQGMHSVAPRDDPAIDRLVTVAPPEVRQASETYRDWAKGLNPADIRAADSVMRDFARQHCPLPGDASG